MGGRQGQGLGGGGFADGAAVAVEVKVPAGGLIRGGQGDIDRALRIAPVVGAGAGHAGGGHGNVAVELRLHSDQGF